MIRCRLQEILDETDTGQRQLARAIGVSTTTINLMCQNKLERINMPTIDKIMNYFGIQNIDDLFYKTEEGTETENNQKDFTPNNRSKFTPEKRKKRPGGGRRIH